MSSRSATSRARVAATDLEVTLEQAWEDQANSKGGKWSVQLPRGKYSAEIDSYWLYTVRHFLPALSSSAPTDRSNSF